MSDALAPRWRLPARATFAALAVLCAALGPPLGAALAQGNAPKGAPPLRIGIVLPPQESGDPLADAVARSAREGFTLADEELGLNAKMLGSPFTLVTASAANPQAAANAARELVGGGAVALVAAMGGGAVEAMTPVAQAAQVPLLNAVASDGSLRNAACSPYLFHIAPSAAMYLDALEGWFVRSGFRNWVFVVADDDAAASQLARARSGLQRSHFGARITASVTVASGHEADAATLAAVRKGRPDAVVLLLPAHAQLAFLRGFEGSGIDAKVTGFPSAEAQTTAFFDASVAAAPKAGAGYRGEGWDPTLDAYGARELNARFVARWGEPMDVASWGAYQAVKVLYASLTVAGAADGPSIRQHLAATDSVFDVWKGIGTSFRPWNGQLRQTLFLTHLSAAADGGAERVLVGELPAIYMPQTDPIERLDQIGDTKAVSGCRM